MFGAGRSGTTVQGIVDEPGVGRGVRNLERLIGFKNGMGAERDGAGRFLGLHVVAREEDRRSLSIPAHARARLFGGSVDGLARVLMRQEKRQRRRCQDQRDGEP